MPPDHSGRRLGSRREGVGEEREGEGGESEGGGIPVDSVSGLGINQAAVPADARGERTHGDELHHGDHLGGMEDDRRHQKE